MTQETVDSRNYSGYMSLVVDLFRPGRNSSSPTPIEEQRNLRRLALIAPFEYAELADAVDEALADLAGGGPLVAREVQALRLRYALDRPGGSCNSYSEVGRKIPGLPINNESGSGEKGISAAQARLLTLKGRRKLGAYSQQHDIYGFSLPDNPGS